MSAGDQQRLELHRKLEEVLGADQAASMMAYLPQAGWADLATRSDLATVEQRLELRFDAVDLRFAAVDQRFSAVDQRFDAVDQRFDAVDRRLEAMEGRLGDFHKELRAMVFGMFGTIVAVVGLVVAGLRL